MNFKRVLTMFLLFCFVVPAVLQAATLQGSISDKSDFGMPGVTVTVTNEKTSEKYTAFTNNGGVFRVLDLIPGKYSIQTYMPGFKTTKLSNVTVKDGKDTTVKLTIEIGID